MKNQLDFSKLRIYGQLMRLDRPIGIYLLLWPTLWSILVASYSATGEGLPSLSITIIFVVGVVLMRSAGCVINDFADRHVDGHVLRTQSRPLATGKVKPQEALQLFALLVSMSFMLVLLLNWQTVLLSVVALVLASLYPFMKRYTHFPQVVLGAAYSWSIPMAAMAILGTIPNWVWYMYAANLCWTIAYDTLYAMVDRNDDLKIGVKSTAIFFGRFDLGAVASLQAIAIILLSYTYYLCGLAWPAYAGLVAAFLLFLKQWSSTKNRDRDACFQAFLDNHWVGMVIAASLAAAIFIQWY
ncbi:4-hydroxybenzoate octaprenyltransferase [Agaribacter flavus]|uniref:4-hydroxybenzoate octaprenyltransferase n=1 Tax=Agaribacter flavus TaxID=1902781 RepID=A0ABV7FRY2_9ALTE